MRKIFTSVLWSCALALSAMTTYAHNDHVLSFYMAEANADYAAETVTAELSHTIINISDMEVPANFLVYDSLEGVDESTNDGNRQEIDPTDYKSIGALSVALPFEVGWLRAS